MTREEREQAIAYLETSFVAESNTDGGWSTHHNNVIRTAIKALEQEPTDENLHREREQAYMQGYEDASKKYRQEPNGDVVSRQAVQIELAKCEVVDIHDENDNLVGYYNADTVDSIVRNLSSVKPQEQTGYWIRISPAGIYECSECGQNVMTSDICVYKFCHGCGARMVEPQERSK